jgi:hypothetical protein
VRRIRTDLETAFRTNSLETARSTEKPGAELPRFAAVKLRPIAGGFIPPLL